MAGMVGRSLSAVVFMTSAEPSGSTTSSEPQHAGDCDMETAYDRGFLPGPEEASREAYVPATPDPHAE